MKEYDECVVPDNVDCLTTKDTDEVIEELMTLYSKKVYLLAYSFVKNHGNAEDITQEVFIKCYKNLDKYRGDATISTWIYRITVNTAKDFLHKNKLMQFVHPLKYITNLVNDQTPEQALIEKNQKEQVLHAIFSLQIRYREILILYYFHDQKIDEISETLHVNANTVKSRLVRGRRKLKQKLTSLRGKDIYG